MQTTTQRKKGWWKIWLLIAIVITVFAVAVVLYYVGYDYISWIGTYLMGAKMWGSAAWVSAAIESVIWVGIGGGLVWLYYNYIRGQKTTSPAPPGGYIAQGQAVTAQKSDTETVVST